MAVVQQRKRRRKERVLRERASATSKKSTAGRLKYDMRLLGSGKDRDL
jgi:hypothetical protein